MKTHISVPPVRLGFCLSVCLSLIFLSGCAGSSPNTSSSSAGGGGGTSTPAALSIGSVAPKDIPAGSTTVTVIVTGTGFTTNTKIVLAGVTESTTYVSASQIQAVVPAIQLQTGTILKLSVADGAQVVAADATNNVQVSNPVPTVASLAPAAFQVGSAAGTITITGTDFVSGVALSVNGSPRATTFVSPTQITATLSADDFAAAAPLLLNAVNPQPGGGASGTIAVPVTNPSPVVAAVSPSFASAGSAALSVDVTGSGFVAGTGLLVNGASRASTFVSASAMKITLTAADLKSSGTLAITAINPSPGGGVSSSSSFAVNNPAPGAITVTPSAALAGATGAQVNVAGSNFRPSTVIYVNNAPRSTTYVSSTQVVASLNASDLAAAGTLSILATNPTPGGGSSASVSFAVNNPQPGAINVTPNLVSTGTNAETPIIVTGANFVSSTVVQINGSARATTFIGSTQLLSRLSVADQAASGSLSVTAVTPAPGGGTSSAASIAINNPTLGSISLSPSTVPAGRTTDTVVTVTGSNMLPGTGIQVNGSARATTYINATQLTFVLLASDVATVGKLNITANYPAPNSGISPVATLSVVAATATPVITSINPNTAIVGSSSFTLTVSGSGFTPTCTLQWNSTSLSTGYSYLNTWNPGTGTYVNTYVLYGVVPASLLTATGSFSITANCPTAITPVSNAVTLSVTDPPVPTLTSLSVTSGPIATDMPMSIYGTGFSATSVVTYNGVALTTTYTSSSALSVTLPASQLRFPGNGSISVSTPAPGGGTSASLVYTAYVPIVSNSMVYNPVNGLLYLSIPSSAGAPYGNSIVSMDPATGALGTPIPVGSEPNKLAITSDGKYLWVGLDGASGVRKVDLTTNTAGLQFALAATINYNIGPSTTMSLLALPGAADSVIVLQGQSGYYTSLGIYDSGVLRGTLTTANFYSQYALQVDATRSEVYVGGAGLYTFTYDASGLTAKVTNTNSNISLANSTSDEMQLSGGKLYGDLGKIYDAEAGTLLGTLYQTGTTSAQGATLFDATLNKIFVLSNSACCYSGATEIQIFNPTDFSASTTTIPVNVPSSIATASNSSVYLYGNRLVRWGSNGLAFHTGAAIFSLQSNSVKDLSTILADLSVTAVASGSTTTGSTSTYTVAVKNGGPSTASDVALAIQVPSNGVLASATTTSGSCATSTSGCNLGSIANGSTVNVTITVLQTSAGIATLNARVSSSSTDNNNSNDAASASLTVTGADYNLAPFVSSISPGAIKSGSSDTPITVTGLNFVPTSTVMLGTTALSTTYSSATQLTATVPAADLANMGWSAISVSSPTPGGGASNATPLTVYSVLALGVNHILYDPYSRKLMASVSTGSSTTAGNSLVSITPETATIGTPLAMTNTPTKLALSDSGQTLYIANGTAASLVRYNMLTGTSTNVAIPYTQNFYTPYPQEIAIQPGTENTLALSLGNYYYGTGVYDYSTTASTLTQRPNFSNYSSFTCMKFLDADSLYANSDGSSLTYFGVNSSGLTSTTGTTSSPLARFNCFKIAGNKAFASGGGVVSLGSGGTVTQLGSFASPSVYYSYGYGTGLVAPDLSLGQVYFPGSTATSSYGYTDGLLSYDAGNYLLDGSISLNMAAVEGSSSYTVQDLVRWGQDGLAAVTSTGHIYLVRGPFVVPQLLNTNTSAALASVSTSTMTHGTGNTLLTLTGSNFLPGVAVTWNGSYRTTTIVDATHVTVAIPASDLAAAGTGSLVATNPGAGASSAVIVTIQ